MFYFDNSYTAHLAPNCLEAPWGRHIDFLSSNNVRYINNLGLSAHTSIVVRDFKRNAQIQILQGRNTLRKKSGE